MTDLGSESTETGLTDGERVIRRRRGGTCGVDREAVVPCTSECSMTGVNRAMKLSVTLVMGTSLHGKYFAAYGALVSR